MESVFIFLLIALADPVRWLISIAAAWLVPSLIGAVAVSVVAATGLSFIVIPSPIPAALLIGAIGSAAITSSFFLLRRKLRNKKLQHEAGESSP